jgi:hypothetical protein
LNERTPSGARRSRCSTPSRPASASNDREERRGHGGVDPRGTSVMSLAIGVDSLPAVLLRLARFRERHPESPARFGWPAAVRRHREGGGFRGGPSLGRVSQRHPETSRNFYERSVFCSTRCACTSYLYAVDPSPPIGTDVRPPPRHSHLMSTQPTTDRTRTDPTLTDSRWTTEGTEVSPPAGRAAQRQFATEARYRLPNLVDDENRAMF